MKISYFRGSAQRVFAILEDYHYAIEGTTDRRYSAISAPGFSPLTSSCAGPVLIKNSYLETHCQKISKETADALHPELAQYLAIHEDSGEYRIAILCQDVTPGMVVITSSGRHTVDEAFAGMLLYDDTNDNIRRESFTPMTGIIRIVPLQESPSC